MSTSSANLLQPILEAAGYTVDETRLKRVVPLLQVRLKSTARCRADGGFLLR